MSAGNGHDELSPEELAEHIEECQACSFHAGHEAGYADSHCDLANELLAIADQQGPDAAIAHLREMYVAAEATASDEITAKAQTLSEMPASSTRH